MRSLCPCRLGVTANTSPKRQTYSEAPQKKKKSKGGLLKSSIPCSTIQYVPPSPQPPPPVHPAHPNEPAPPIRITIDLARQTIVLYVPSPPKPHTPSRHRSTARHPRPSPPPPLPCTNESFPYRLRIAGWLDVLYCTVLYCTCVCSPVLAIGQGMMARIRHAIRQASHSRSWHA
jgi:hypothetical protein